ncbi:hypothetical protein N7501_008799 [Penicillium viridicatum]|nr:hypothetical protein N7501_008799 [Penicillium viridicatum]
MYKPTPRRPKKTSIVRSRSGCKACRQRRVKCDEKQPSCSACVRRGNKCEAITPNFDFRDGVMLGAKRCNKRKTTHSKELPIQGTTTQDELCLSGSDDYLIEPNHRDNAPTPAPYPIDDEWLSCSPSTPQSLTTNFPSPLPNQIIRSLGRSENELFYLTHWEKSCVQSLPSFQAQITAMAEEHAPLLQALLALSACNISRSLPEGTEGGIGTSLSQIIYRPRRDYLLSSQHYYGTAIKQIAKTIGKGTSSSISHTLAAMVLFCYLESAMGNFASFACHTQGADTFINTHLTKISSDPIGRELIAAWVLAKYHTWWLRMNFSSFSFQLHQDSLCLSPVISNMLRSINAERVIVTSILCESYRLNNIALLQLGPCRTQSSGVTVEECIASLRIESRKLDEWHAELPQSELPIESFSGIMDHDEGGIRPLMFKSHYFAMNYAYYVSSRIMQCTALLRELRCTRSESNDPEKKEVNYWMALLVRIVSGINKQDCFKGNVYSIGASSLLVACLLRCQNLTIGRWIEKWLHEWSILSILEEGSFPIFQALKAIRLINEEKAAGNDIYALALPDDDGGGTGKYMSYNSQHFDKMVTLGRRGTSGRLYSELVPINTES